MTYEELDALLDAGDTKAVAKALAEQQEKPQEQRYLSGEQVQLIEAKLARVKELSAPSKKSEEAKAEEPVEEAVPVDSEPEPKAEPKQARRSSPSGRGKKGK